MKRPPPRSVLARRSPCAGLRFVLLAASVLLRLATALLAGASGATTSSSASSSRPAREVGESSASAVEAAAAVGLGSDDAVVLPDFSSYNVQADVMSTPLIHSGSPSGYLRRTADEEDIDAGRDSSFSDAAAREASGRVEEVVQGPHPPVIRHLRSTSGAGSSTATVDDGARTSALGLATAASSGSPPHTPVQQVEVQPHQAQELQLAAAPAVVPAARAATLPLGGHQRRPAPGQQQRRIPNPRAPTARNGFDSRFAGRRPNASVRFFLGNTDSPGGSPGVVVRGSVSNEVVGPQHAAAVEVADDPFGLQTISTQAHQRSRAPTNLGRFGGAGLQVVNGEVVAAIDENASELSSEVPSQITSQPSQATLSSGASSGVLLRAFRLQTPRIFGGRYGEENSADPYLYRNAMTGSTRDLMQPPARAGGERNEAGVGATGARGQPDDTRAGQESQSQEPSTTSSASIARVNPAHQRQPTSSLERVLLPTRRLLGYLSAGPSAEGAEVEAEPDVERAGAAPTPGGNNRIGRVNRSGTRRDHHVFFDEDEAVQPGQAFEQRTVAGAVLNGAAALGGGMSSLLRSASTTAAGAVSAGGRLLLPGIVPGGGIIGGSTAASFPSDRMSPSLRDGSRSLQDGHERLALASRAAPSAMGGLGVVQGRPRDDSEDHSGALPLPLSSRASNRASTAGSISSFASAAVGWMPSISTSGPRTGRKQSTLSTAFPSAGDEVPPGDSDAEMEVDPDVSKDEADASEVSSEPAQCAICLGALDEESSELSRSDTALLADRGDDGEADAGAAADATRGSSEDPRESSHRPRQNAASSSASSSQETSAPRPPPPPTPPEGTTATGTRQVAGEVPLMKQKVFIPTCAHKSATLHRECLKTWILKRNGNSQKCPICRNKMSFEFLQAMIHDQELPTTVSDAHLRELAREQSSQAERQRAATERAAIAQAPQQQRMLGTDGAADINFSMEEGGGPRHRTTGSRLEELAEHCTNCCIDTVTGCCRELCCKDPGPCAVCVCCVIIYCCDAGTKWAVEQRAACLHEVWPKHAQIWVPGENGTTTRHVHFGMNENMLQSFRGYNQGYSTFLYVSEEVGGEEDNEAGGGSGSSSSQRHQGRRQYGAWKPLNFERAAKTLAEIDWEEEQSRPSCTEGKAKCDAEDVEQAYIRCMQKFDGPMDVSIRRRKNPHVAKNTRSSGGTHAFLGPAGNNLASAPPATSTSSSSSSSSGAASSAGSAEGAKEQDHQHQTVVK